MKSIKIGNKDYELNFGIRFSRALSRVYTMERNIEGHTMKFGLGVRMVVGYLETADPDAIFNSYKAALAKHKKMPTDEQIEDALDKATWEKLTSQFWLDTRIPVSNDRNDWRILTQEERDVVNKAFVGLTLLDTLQS